MSEHEPPEFLIKDILQVGTAAALIGAPAAGKTFVALDMAFAVAGGTPWLGCETKPTPVAYIIAEGTGGIGNRLRAWRTVHDIPAGVPVGIGLWFWDRDVQLATFAGREALRTALTEIAQQIGAAPGFIIVDTLARCFVGMDENSAQAMSQFVAGIDVLRSTGATVLVIHHEGHLAGRERGSSALRGAVDTMLYLGTDHVSGAMMINCMKQREVEPFDTLYIRLRSVELPNDTTSCVVEALPSDQLPMSPKWIAAVQALAKYPEGATRNDWYAISALPRSSFFKMRKEALARGLVVERNDLAFLADPNAEVK